MVLSRRWPEVSRFPPTPPCSKRLVCAGLHFFAGHRSYLPGSPAFKRVVEAFGNDVVDSEGSINRRILGSKVFASKVGHRQFVTLNRLTKYLLQWSTSSM